MPVLFTTFKTDLNQFGLQFFDLPNLSTYVAPIAFLMPAYLVGWVFGFLLLEDRDDHTLLAVETTAVGKQGFLHISPGDRQYYQRLSLPPRQLLTFCRLCRFICLWRLS